MARGKRKTHDEQLPDGSTVLWSERFTRDGRLFVPVRCGVCGQTRTVVTSGIQNERPGNCRECSTKVRRTLIRNGDQVLPNGSIIHWDSEQYDERYPTRRRVVTVRCGGRYCGGSTRQVPVFTASQAGFTGLCRRCAHYGPSSGRWKGGRKKNAQGYNLIKLPPEHPLYSMVDKNGYVLEHRFVMAEKLGRPLRNDEIVHHRNRKKGDNRLENLQLLVEHHHVGYDTVPLVQGDNGQ